MFNNVWNETLTAWRGMLRRPGFALLATVTLSLGIASSVVSFGLIERLLLQPLPFPEARALYAAGLKLGNGSNAITPAEYRTLQALELEVDSGLVSNFPREAAVRVDRNSFPAMNIEVDKGFLRVLDVPMALGRGFVQAEMPESGPATTIVVSWRFWQERFEGRTDVLGAPVSVDGVPMSIVGVLPPDFRLPLPFDIMTPVALDAALADGRNYTAVLRLPDSVAAFGSRILESLRQHNFGSDQAEQMRNADFGITPLITLYRAPLREVLVLFMACSLCVLLLASVNVVNLMLLRMIRLRRSRAIRSALGSSRFRLVVPAVAEGILIGFLSALAGLLIAWLTVGVWRNLVPPAWQEFLMAESFGGWTVAFALMAGLVPAMIAALFGTWRDRRGAVGVQLNSEARSGTSVGVGKLTRGLVIVQITIGVFLLVVAGAFLRSLEQASHVDPGFATEQVWSFEVRPPNSSQLNGGALIERAERLLDRLRDLPAVEAATYATNMPIGAPLNYAFQRPGGDIFSVEFRGVGSSYFDTLDIPLLAGRLPGPGDHAGGEPVAFVNRAFVERRFGSDGDPTSDGMPLGERLEMPLPDGTLIDLRIAGVVQDTRQFGPTQPAPEIVYLPMAQLPTQMVDLLRQFVPLRYAVVARSDVSSTIDAVEAAVRAVFPEQPGIELKAFSDLLHDSTRQTRLILALVAVFAGLALSLSTIGMYSVVAVAAQARTREFAIRAALGATFARLAAKIMSDGMLQGGVGLVAGFVLAALAAGVISSLVPGISIGDPVILVPVALLTLASAIIASLVPARRLGGVSISRELGAD